MKDSGLPLWVSPNRRPVYVSTKDAFPTKEHWVIIKFGQHRGSYDGVDGQVDYQHGIENYIAYDNEDEWKAEIIKLTENKHGYSTEQFVAFKASKPVSTRTTVVVDIE